jgi:hypothetical protein
LEWSQNKTELVKEVMPIGILMTSNNYYKDLNKATTKQTLKAILSILENQEEDIALVGKQEWMQSWPKHTNPCTPIINIHEIAQDKLLSTRV